MAKMGEGDPRWLVQERDDGVNVNNWHWAEKNIFGWIGDHIHEHLQDKVLYEGNDGQIRTGEVSKVEGDGVLMVRKGRVKQIYDLSFEVKLTGTYMGSDLTCKIAVRDLDQDGGMEEAYCSIVGGSKDAKVWFRSSGLTAFHQAVLPFLDHVHQLREEWSAQLLKGESAKGDSAKGKGAKVQLEKAEKVEEKKGRESYSSQVQLKASFKCRAGELFSCLTDKGRMMVFTQGHAQVESREGGSFVLYDGLISGIFESILPHTKVVMQWRLRSWEAGKYSTVEVDIRDTSDGCVAEVTQMGVPRSEVDAVKAGWEQYYWSRIKGAFGYGSL